MPVLPQEDPKELEERTQQAITAMKPRNPLEHDLVCRAVRLSGELDRAERVATAHLAHRVRMAERSGPETVSACELKKVHELGSKLFYKAGIGPGYSSATADDYPAVIVRRLEASAEGCRWMLARWAELLNVLDCKAAWGDPEIIRFVGLLGKRGIEAHFDPELNSLFHAFDALGNRIGHKFWKERRDRLPLGYQGGFEFVPYREIAPAPSDQTARNAERGTGNGEKADGKCQMTDGKCRMADDRGQMVDDECEVRSGGCGNGESGQPTPEASQSAIVGYDSNRVIDDSTNDKIGILSHEGMNLTDRPYQGACDRQSLPSGVKTPRNVQNEANLELTQSSLPLMVKSYSTEPAGRKRSQSAAGSTVPHDAGNDPFDPIAPAREGKERAWGTASIKSAV